MNMKKTVFTLLVSILSTVVCAQGLAGSWKGKLNVGNMQLTLVFNITECTDGKLSCTMDSPDQGAKGIPAEIETDGDAKVKISVAAIGMTYAGELKDGQICGRFSQHAFSTPLNLSPGKAEMNRPQTPEPPFPYTTEEVTFTNPTDNATLSGTLTLPSATASNSAGVTPVVVMVSGSGLQNRDEEVFGHKPFLVLADRLARSGIASLRYDDRSVGKSTGDVSQATTETFMRDAAAAVDFLRRSGRFARVGVLGHSEGGTIAFILGAGGVADFVVSMAGAALPGDSILLEQNRALLTMSGLPSTVCDDYCSALGAVLNRLSSGESVGDADAAVSDILSEAKISLPADMQKNLVAVVKTFNPWLKHFVTYNPQKDISSVKCPVMAINGSLDVQVLSSSNLDAVRRLLPTDSRNVVKEYAGLNHLFQHCTTGSVAEYGKIEETMSTEVMDDIASWIISSCTR